MGIGKKRGASGGGAAQNFKIVGGTAQPSGPSENTIWVNTDTKITSWVFSARSPEVPAEGMVWVATVTSSRVAFNALKKNSIEICPISAKQYVDGAWVNRPAMIYQNGEWNEWYINFYLSGVFSAQYETSEKLTPSNAVITYNESDIELSTVAGKTSEVYVVIGEVDLTNLSKLVLTGTFTKASTSTFTNVATIFVAADAGSSYKNAAAIASLVTSGALDAGYAYSLELDVSGLTGKYFIHAGLNTQGDAWSGQRINTITMIRGE